MPRSATWSTLAVFLCLTGWTEYSCAQTVRTDTQTGDRIVAYEVDGVAYEALVPGNDRINPESRLISAERVSNLTRYTYRFFNHRGEAALPERGLWMVDIPCRGVTATGIASAAGDWLAELVPASVGSICRFSTLAQREMQPGDSSTLLTVESRFLPAFVVARGYGVAGPHTIPTDEESTPDTLRGVIIQLRAPGGSGSGREMTAVAPFYDPDALPGPITAIQLMRADLLAMCGAMGWITNQGICRSLETKLRNAEAAFMEDDIDQAARMVQAFTSELNAQRGRHVPEPAYAMLFTFLTHLRGRM
jgi:hypothetical protein